MSITDPFVYAGTNVLKNTYNITVQRRLSYYEGAFAAYRLQRLDLEPIAGNHDVAHLRAIHRFVFQDIYPWAGETRENLHARISKARPDGTPVDYPIGPLAVAHANKVCAELKAENYLRGKPADELAARLAYYYSELDYCHIFREGNSRTLRVFSSSLAREAGHTLTWEHVRNRQEDLYRARDHAAFSMASEKLIDPQAPLAAIIREGLDKPTAQRDRALQGRLDAIMAYPGDGGSQVAPPELRGVFKHLDRLRADIEDMPTTPAGKAAMFDRIKARAADQYEAGYRFPESGEGPQKGPARSRSRGDDRER